MIGDELLFDTNAFIAWASQDPLLAQRTVGVQTLSVAVVTLGELYFGAEKSKRVEENLKSLEERLAEFRVVYLDQTTTHIYGKVCLQLRRKGRPIPINDLWIASLALQYDLPLVSRDSHFRHVDGISLIVW